MKTLKNIVTGLGLVACVGMAAQVFAVEIDADEFVEEASAKGVAEIETSKLALQKSTSPNVKAFAQKMIDDHTKANAELAAIAKAKKLEVSSESELKNKAKAFILKQRDGESFDEAYANNQVMAHKESIALFKEGTDSGDAEINAYAKNTLPKLEHHLQMAQELAKQTTAANNDDDESHSRGQSHSSHAN